MQNVNKSSFVLLRKFNNAYSWQIKVISTDPINICLLKITLMHQFMQKKFSKIKWPWFIYACTYWIHLPIAGGAFRLLGAFLVQISSTSVRARFHCLSKATRVACRSPRMPVALRVFTCNKQSFVLGLSSAIFLFNTHYHHSYGYPLNWQPN